MPGASSILDKVDPTTFTESPEEVKIWLPSQLPPSSRDAMCVPGLPELEFRFRLAQAYDALDLIRRLYGAYQVLLTKNQVHLSASQGTTTKTKALFRNFTLKIDQAAARYRDARTALLRLDPKKPIDRHWKDNLKELRRDHIRGPARQNDELSESKRQTSWIWQTSSLKKDAGINSPELQGIMRAEWCRAKARVQRFEEEVELTVEEMRRTLQFFRWTADRWEKRGRARDCEPMLEGATMAGIKAYAAYQASIYRRMVSVFLQDWYECLERKSLGSDWLTDYTRPEVCRRRRLPSYVTLYHPSAPSDLAPDELDGALVNDPQSDVEMRSVGPESDVDMDCFDDV